MDACQQGLKKRILWINPVATNLYDETMLEMFCSRSRYLAVNFSPPLS